MSVRFFFYFSFSFILRKHEQIRGKCCVHSLSKSKQKIKNEIENLNTYPKICKTNFLRFEHQLANNLIFFSFCISFQNIKRKMRHFREMSRKSTSSDFRRSWFKYKTKAQQITHKNITNTILKFKSFQYL